MDKTRIALPLNPEIHRAKCWRKCERFVGAQEINFPEKFFPVTCFLVTDISPEFPGGAYALQKMLRDSIGSIFAGPEEGAQNSISLRFSVEKDGSITEVEPAQQHPDWVRTAYIDRCIFILRSMPRWSPGIWKDKPVKVKMMISMNLKE